MDAYLSIIADVQQQGQLDRNQYFLEKEYVLGNYSTPKVLG
jgi:hypothetical protein